MDRIRWSELPEARQLASLGKRLSKAGQQRLQWMLFYSFNRRNVARTCRHFSISRQTFYRWWRRFDRHDLRTLEERSHRPHRVRQPTWSAAAAERLLALRRENHRLSTSMVGRILTHLKRRGVLHEHPGRPCCSASIANYENAPGPFASLNTGELPSPEIS